MIQSLLTTVIDTLRGLPYIDGGTFVMYILHLIIFIILFETLRMILKLMLNKQLAFVSKPYSSSETHDKRILILGDSTAVGTGASSPDDTIAGRLARDFPDSQIINLAENGGLIRDLTTQIASVKDQQFNMIIISAGGNDVWHFSRQKNIRKHLAAVFAETTRMSDHHVVFLLYNNIGSAPIFPRPIQAILKIYGSRMHASVRLAADAARIPVIELFTNDADNPFIKNPAELFARDGIHPSSRGYELWYNRMWRRMAQDGFRYD